ncbi:MAG: hypothetical protein DRJ52_08340 [Thermoprotei archaeon]|nr:MAG: hypothetical protein DRJ52_08340 [Thermoprotei archaeon]
MSENDTLIYGNEEEYLYVFSALLPKECVFMEMLIVASSPEEALEIFRKQNKRMPVGVVREYKIQHGVLPQPKLYRVCEVCGKIYLDTPENREKHRHPQIIQIQYPHPPKKEKWISGRIVDWRTIFDEFNKQGLRKWVLENENRE